MLLMLRWLGLRLSLGLFKLLNAVSVVAIEVVAVDVFVMIGIVVYGVT